MLRYAQVSFVRASYDYMVVLAIRPFPSGGAFVGTDGDGAYVGAYSPHMLVPQPLDNPFLGGNVSKQHVFAASGTPLDEAAASSGVDLAGIVVFVPAVGGRRQPLVVVGNQSFGCTYAFRDIRQQRRLQPLVAPIQQLA